MAVVFLLGVFFIVYSNTVKSESDILIYFYAGLSFFIYSVLFLIFDPSYSIEITTEDITILRQNRLWEARTEIISKKSIRAATLVQSNLLGVVFYDIHIELLDGTKVPMLDSIFILEKFNKNEVFILFSALNLNV